MYNEADAVAKLDGYMISVAGAGPLIGKRTLVRIDAVGRSAAEASLVEGAEVTEATGSNEALTTPVAAESGERKPRRRGRRGGRGRRKAAESSESAEQSED